MTTRLSDIIDPAAEARLRALAEGTAPPQGEVKADEPVFEVKADDDAALERKADPGLGGAQVLSADDETGVVEALVSVTGVEDRVKDVIEPGAYTKTMSEREPIGVWSHDDKTWVARTEDAVELMPGDPFFKGLTTMDGKPWPREAGAVKVKARFNLDTPHGKAAYSDVKFFQGKTGWSIGYRATKAHRNPRTGVRHIKELDWYEYSPVMVGAASQPMTLSVKSLAQPVDPDDTAGVADAAVIATLTEAEVKAYHDLRESMGLETKDRVASQAGAQRYGKPIGSLIDDDGDSGKAGDYKVNSIEDVRNIMKSWSRVPMEARAALKKRLEAWLEQHSGGDEQHRRLNALVGGLGDGDGKREAGEGAGRALANNGRTGGDRWLARQRAKKGFDDSMIEVKDGVRRIRTPEGAAFYGQPIGSIIKPDAPGGNSSSGGAGSSGGGSGSAGGGFVGDNDPEKMSDDDLYDEVDLLLADSGSGYTAKEKAVMAEFVKRADAGKFNAVSKTAVDRVRQIAGPPAKPSPSAAASAAPRTALDPRLKDAMDEKMAASKGKRGMKIADLAYALGIPNARAKDMLDRAIEAGHFENRASGGQYNVFPANGGKKADLGPIEVKRSSASLDRSPRSNWVERTGDLPRYVREVARAIHEDQGLPLDRAIPIAIGRIKRWAAGGGDVTAATRAKAAKAVAEWEALKAKAGAKFDSDLLEHIEHKAEMLADRVEQAWALLAEVGEVKFVDDDGVEVKWDGSPVETKGDDPMPGDVDEDDDDEQDPPADEQDDDDEDEGKGGVVIDDLLARALEIKAAYAPNSGG